MHLLKVEHNLGLALFVLIGRVIPSTSKLQKHQTSIEKKIAKKKICRFLLHLFYKGLRPVRRAGSILYHCLSVAITAR